MDKGLYHAGEIPWREVLVSGHALSAERSKISKSKGNSHAGGPLELVERESADALRYWAISIKPGLDTPFHPELIVNGRRLVTKLWNASRFAARHLQELSPEEMTSTPEPNGLLSTDRSRGKAVATAQKMKQRNSTGIPPKTMAISTQS
ncbi:class I tRNA ligase family protein [Ktedonobacter racemifer]|uniref:class I tRNA ligase family protein n=1 Tax=Ktedonobacter racemifer TaxID=363277 RepID=UPI0002E05D18|nr:class I tRNA ligase family protein [Ktedonobacter racemifer]